MAQHKAPYTLFKRNKKKNPRTYCPRRIYKGFFVWGKCKWTQRRQSQGYAATEVMSQARRGHLTKHIRDTFNIVLNEARRERLIKTNPIDDVGRLSKSNYKKRDTLSMEELRTLFPKDEQELMLVENILPVNFSREEIGKVEFTISE